LGWVGAELGPGVESGWDVVVVVVEVELCVLEVLVLVLELEVEEGGGVLVAWWETGGGVYWVVGSWVGVCVGGLLVVDCGGGGAAPANSHVPESTPTPRGAKNWKRPSVRSRPK
jgi:hypothetical protein